VPTQKDASIHQLMDRLLVAQINALPDDLSPRMTSALTKMDPKEYWPPGEKGFRASEYAALALVLAFTLCVALAGCTIAPASDCAPAFSFAAHDG
jgi:hypothetical protein